MGFLKIENKVGKAVRVIGIGLSLYPIAKAEEWGRELGYQVESWSGGIAGGRLGVGVGAIVDGPVGAILGGMTGSILGGIGAVALGNWFFAAVPEAGPSIGAWLRITC